MTELVSTKHSDIHITMSFQKFPDDEIRKKSILSLQPNYMYFKTYDPSQRLKRELPKNSGRLTDCMYDEYCRGMPPPTSIASIDNEMPLLKAAEEKLRQSRIDFRRMARMIVPRTGPSEKEKHELESLSFGSFQVNYELEDFIQDFDKKPFVATRLLDFSFQKIELRIKGRQSVLRDLRNIIHETSVYGYQAAMEKRRFKKTPPRSRFLFQSAKHIIRTAVKESAMEISKSASETALRYSKLAIESALENSKTERKKFMHASRVRRESVSEDVTHAKKLKVYQAEILRFEENLEMFGAQLQEFANPRRNIRRVARKQQNVEAVSREDRTTRPRTVGPEPKKTEDKINMVETDKPLEGMVRNDHHDKFGSPTVVSQDGDATDVSHDHFEDSDPPTVKTERQVSNTAMEEAQISSDHERIDKREPKGNMEANGNMSTQSGMSDTEAKWKLLVMQPSSDEETRVDIPQKLPVQPVNQVRSDVVKQLSEENKESTGIVSTKSEMSHKTNDTEAKKKLLLNQPSNDEDDADDIPKNLPVQLACELGSNVIRQVPKVKKESTGIASTKSEMRQERNESEDEQKLLVMQPSSDEHEDKDDDISKKLPVQPVCEVGSNVTKQEPKENKESFENLSTKPEKKPERNCSEAQQKLLVILPSSDENEDKDDDVPQNLPVQSVNQVGSNVTKQVPDENKESTEKVSTKSEMSHKRNDSEAKMKLLVIQPSSDDDDDVPREVTVHPVCKVGRVILPLPTLNPMPVYTDNFQASCVLTHLFSSRDEFHEDFEPDYVIPSYKSERLVSTGKQQ